MSSFYPPSSTLNIRCGDDLREKLPAADIAGDYLSFVDPVCQGPVPALEGEAFHRQRAGFIAKAYGVAESETFDRLREEQAGLERSLAYDRVVLWCEHDLYDQSVLIRLLAWYADRPQAAGRLYLLQLDSFPGVERFIGLGQLTARQLATLAGSELPIGAEQFELGRAAWAAFRSPSPESLQALIETDTPALPLLAPALRRHLQEFPWTGDGLGLTQRLALQSVDRGEGREGSLFRAFQALDPMPFLGDSMFDHVLRGLAESSCPAISFGDESATLTQLGRALLAGQADWVALNGIEQWHGGVQLIGTRSAWRWNPDRERIEAA